MLDEVYFLHYIIYRNSKVGKGKLCQMAEKKSWENEYKCGERGE